MKFGKLPHIEDVDFSLPPDNPVTSKLLEILPEGSTSPHVYIGCTGWSMKEWIGKVYPKGAKPKEFLRYYSRQFDTIELNTTHYRTPTPETIQNWYRETPANFRFCPKILQTVSHSRDLGFGTGKLLHFCEALLGLQEKLGPCFMQLPPYFGHDRLGMLERFIQSFPKDIRLTIELRHESCFTEPEKTTEIFSMLKSYGIGLVITDVAGRRDVAHMGISAPFSLIRFVGNNLHPTDYTRIDAWVLRLKTWAIQGLKEVYFFPHEPDNIQAPEMALYLAQKIKEMTPIQVCVPDFNKKMGGGQMELF